MCHTVHCTDPAKDTFATATRSIKPKCLAHTCVDSIHRCVTVAGLNIREGNTIS